MIRQREARNRNKLAKMLHSDANCLNEQLNKARNSNSFELLSLYDHECITNISDKIGKKEELKLYENEHNITLNNNGIESYLKFVLSYFLLIIDTVIKVNKMTSMETTTSEQTQSSKNAANCPKKRKKNSKNGDILFGLGLFKKKKTFLANENLFLQ